MALTLGIQEPTLYISAPQKANEAIPYGVTTGHTTTAIIYRGDFVTLSAGLLNRAATTAATDVNTNVPIAGMAMQGELDVFGNVGAPASTADNLIFGVSQAGSVGSYMPNEPNSIHVVPVRNNQQFVMSLPTSVAWAESLIGTTAGLAFDATTNFFYCDTTSATYKQLTIVGKTRGPQEGDVGDFNARVVVSFNTTGTII